MPEETPKLPQNLSPPMATAGAGDISERELSRERHNLSTTPPARVQPAHPKKQLFSSPVNKFTAKSCGPSPNLARLRSCLHKYTTHATPTRRARIGPKAVSMEDLTPEKRVKRQRKVKCPVVHLEGPSTALEQQAAARVGRFMLVSAWRRRRAEVRCLRKTLESQVSCSERLRIQVSTLKSLLDSDNMKVRLAMKELERLKLMLRDKEAERALLEREKVALEGDVCAADDRASEMSIGWRNCRNELESVRISAAACARALANERGYNAHARERISLLESELSVRGAAVAAAEAECCALRKHADDTQRTLDNALEQLAEEQDARTLLSAQCTLLQEEACLNAKQHALVQDDVRRLHVQLQRVQRDLQVTTEQLHWWPKPLTRLMGAARYWLRRPMSLPEAFIWALVPARHGC